MRIIPVDGGIAVYYAVIDNDGNIVAQGCEALCQAVINGTVQVYIESCQAEREANGIGVPRIPKPKKGKAAKPADPPYKPKQMSLL